MKQNLTAKVEVVINVPVHRVWESLTDPKTITQYLFGTEVVTDWKAGSPIIWKGVWQGKTYEDKGKIVRIIPDKLLETTYWSGMSGLSDIPENYKLVTYELIDVNGNTKLILTQDNNPTVADKDHSEKNWTMVLGVLKKLLEK
jgi:uncharacterized protein YndB with AHSA1/START domain